MDFTLTDGQHAIAEAARHHLGRVYPPQRVAELADTDAPGAYADRAGWAELVRQGWFDPGLGGVERGLLAEAAGYALLPVPWPVALAAAGTLPGEPTDGPLALVHDGVVRADDRLTGTAEPVTDAGAATTLVVTTAGATYAVPADAPGVTLTELSGVDGLRRGWRVRFDDAEAVPLTVAAGAGAVLTRRLAALAAAEAVGVAARALDLAVEYAGIRVQFGRPIGAYQAVAGQLADAYAQLELARSLAYRAAWCTGEPDAEAGETERAVRVAVVAGRRAALTACETAMQVLGGVAMTWEHPVHRWYRRALWLDADGPATRDHLATLAAELLADAAAGPAGTLV